MAQEAPEKLKVLVFVVTAMKILYLCNESNVVLKY